MSLLFPHRLPLSNSILNSSRACGLRGKNSDDDVFSDKKRLQISQRTFGLFWNGQIDRLMVVSLQVELQYFQKKFSFFKFSVNFLSLGAFPVLYFVVKIHVTYNISERRKINCFWQYFESRQAENESFML